MMAARSVELDKPGMDALFWSGTKVKTAFILATGHGEGSAISKKRLDFDFTEACVLL